MTQRFLFVLAQIVHVEVAMLLGPVLVGLDRQRPHQLGKMRTTWVRRLISSLSRSSMLVDFKCL